MGAGQDNQHLGGLVAEYRGHDSKKVAEAILQKTMQEMFERRYSPDDFELFDIEIIVKSFVPEKEFGTILIVLGFSNYIYQPVTQ